ncbi:MAG: glutathione S-transferase [Arenicellales bacterium]|nr:glutathione S-transferase [Arenicellales bacterium]
MLEIWGRKNSSNVMPVMWALGELGLQHIRHNAGGTFGGLNTDEYGRMNPNRLVPTMKDNGLILWESNAIVRYLASQYGKGTLWPNEVTQRAVADQWMEWMKTTVFPQFVPIFLQLVRTAEQDRDWALVERKTSSLTQALQIFDQWLSNQPYVAGENLTMGDIPMGAIAYRYYNVDIEHPDLPNLERWYRSLCDRPAYQQHVMIPFGKSPEEWLELERAGAED